MAQTTNYSLYLTDNDSIAFKEWREKINGLEDSNMEIIDGALASINQTATNKQDKLSGSKGQLVGFDDDGSAIAQDAPATGVTTFNGRTGAVTPSNNDYTADMVGALPISGGTLSGDLSVASGHGVKVLSSSGTGVEITDSQIHLPRSGGGGVAMHQNSTDATHPAMLFSGMNANESVVLDGIATPTSAQNAANKSYVDQTVESAIQSAILDSWSASY